MRIRFDREALQLAWKLACLPSYGTLRLVQHLVATLARTGIPLIGRDDILLALEMWVGASESQIITRMAENVGDDQPATVVAKAG